MPRTTDLINFGALVKSLRNERGLTQRALAHEVGYAIDTIRKIEQGRYAPSEELVQQLVKFLATAPEEQIALWQAVHHARPELLTAQPKGSDAAETQDYSLVASHHSREAHVGTASMQNGSLTNNSIIEAQSSPAVTRTVIAIFKTFNIYILVGTPIVLLLLAWLGARLFYHPPTRNGLIGLVRSAEGTYLTVEADGRHIGNGDSVPLGTSVTVTFTIRNDDIYSASVLELTAGARGPGGHTLGWNAPDQSFESQRHIVLKPVIHARGAQPWMKTGNPWRSVFIRGLFSG